MDDVSGWHGFVFYFRRELMNLNKRDQQENIAFIVGDTSPLTNV